MRRNFISEGKIRKDSNKFLKYFKLKNRLRICLNKRFQKLNDERRYDKYYKIQAYAKIFLEGNLSKQ